MANILVVEDSGYQRGIICKAIRGLGHNIAEAGTGEDALRALESGGTDLILTDLVMPGMGGVEFLRKLKERNIKKPVVVVSADIQETTRKECMDLGAVGFVPKPLKGESLANLLNIIKAYLE